MATAATVVREAQEAMGMTTMGAAAEPEVMGATMEGEAETAERQVMEAREVSQIVVMTVQMGRLAMLGTRTVRMAKMVEINLRKRPQEPVGKLSNGS